MLITKTTLFCYRNNFARTRTSLAKFCSVQNRTDTNLMEDKLDIDEKELERKRFQSRLPDQVYRKFVKREFFPPVNTKHFRKKHLRSMYGKYGDKTGLNPGIAWPTREELLDIMEHDKVYHHSLHEMLHNVNAAKQKRLQEQSECLAEVEKNMAKLETYKKEYYAKITKKQQEEDNRKLKQQQLIEEISELLGYDVSPKDPKFQEAVEMRKMEEKKAKKVKKQQETHEKMLAKLANLAASAKKVEATTESQSVSEGSSKQVNEGKPVVEEVSKERLSESK